VEENLNLSAKHSRSLPCEGCLSPPERSNLLSLTSSALTKSDFLRLQVSSVISNAENILSPVSLCHFARQHVCHVSVFKLSNEMNVKVVFVLGKQLPTGYGRPLPSSLNLSSGLRSRFCDLSKAIQSVRALRGRAILFRSRVSWSWLSLFLSTHVNCILVLQLDAVRQHSLHDGQH
jgi:hypothetical protein